MEGEVCLMIVNSITYTSVIMIASTILIINLSTFRVWLRDKCNYIVVYRWYRASLFTVLCFLLSVLKSYVFGGVFSV